MVDICRRDRRQQPNGAVDDSKRAGGGATTCSAAVSTFDDAALRGQPSAGADGKKGAARDTHGFTSRQLYFVIGGAIHHRSHAGRRAARQRKASTPSSARHFTSLAAGAGLLTPISARR